MHKKVFKDTTFTLISGLAKAMGNPHRLEILELLINGPKSVEKIAHETRLSVANTSQHLQVLKRHKMVSTHKDGTTVFYLLADKSIVSLMDNLHDIAHKQLPDLNFALREFRPANSITSIDSVPNESHVLLDVRPVIEFENGHKKGAINVPIGQLNAYLTKIDKDKMIVAYCRGELCTYADEAVKILTEAGFNAVRLSERVLKIA